MLNALNDFYIQGVETSIPLHHGVLVIEIIRTNFSTLVKIQDCMINEHKKQSKLLHKPRQ
jgi:hypothetical protein